MKSNSSISNFNHWPKSFLITLFVILTLFCVEVLLLPVNFFTFRVWESLSVKTLNNFFSGPFYPNQTVSMMEEGDLKHHTSDAVLKDVVWKTDQFGYRKEDRGVVNYSVVIVGDSNIVGTSLTQSDMLTEVLERELGVSVYPYAPVDINKFLNDPRFQLNPPKVVVLAVFESGLTLLPEIKVRTVLGNSHHNPLVSFLKKHPSVAIGIDRLSKNAAKQYFRSSVKRLKTKLIIAAKKQSGFDQSSLHETEVKKISANSNIDLKRVVLLLKSYDAYFRSKNIQFIFMPIPIKQSIYSVSSIENKTPLLKDLFDLLKNENLEAINLQNIFEEFKNKISLYHDDDSHWNANGVNVSAEVLSATLKRYIASE